MAMKNSFAAFVPLAKPGSRANHSAFVSQASKTFSAVRDELSKGSSPSKIFAEAAKSHSNLQTLMDAIRIGTNVGSIITGVLPNGENSPTNAAHSLLPFTSASNIKQVGKNDAIYHKTFVHVGKRTSSRIFELAKGPQMTSVKKITSDSLKDYQDHKKRKYLTLSHGFNEKGFTFFLEDTFFSVGDFYEMFQIQNKYKTQLENNDDGIIDIYGCVFKTYNQLVFKNRDPQCTCHIRLHLIKILDIRTNVRSLIQEIVHTSSQSSSFTRGKLPKDFQLSDPDIYNEKNRFGVSFVTTLSARLQQSTRFKEKARIVRSWTSTLSPSSFWEFNLTTHMGRGIHLNTVNDLYFENNDHTLYSKVSTEITKLSKLSQKLRGKTGDENRQQIDEVRSAVDNLFMKRGNEHPASYVLVAEYVGDRRASILRKKDRDIFSGYSHTNIGVEFKTGFSYVADQDDVELPLVYKYIQQDRDFEEGGSLADLFCPDRSNVFHVPLNKIGTGPDKPFKMLYDQVLGTDSLNIIDGLKQTFKEFGMDPKSVTPEDADFDYRGPDTEPPPVEEE